MWETHRSACRSVAGTAETTRTPSASCGNSVQTQIQGYKLAFIPEKLEKYVLKTMFYLVQLKMVGPVVHTCFCAHIISYGVPQGWVFGHLFFHPKISHYIREIV